MCYIVAIKLEAHMTPNPMQDRWEVFDRFDRKSMVALMLVTLLLGGTGLTMALSPRGTVSSPGILQWLVLPVVIAILVSLLISVGRRRFRADSPEVKATMQDEWRRANLLRASRGALFVVLIGQWPLGLMFGFLTHPTLTPPRIASAMAAGTIMLGVVTLVALFFLLDRE
jgi:hypothetical protein